MGWWSCACFVYGCFGCVLGVLVISGYLVMLLWVAGRRLWWFEAWFLGFLGFLVYGGFCGVLGICALGAAV